MKTPHPEDLLGMYYAIPAHLNERLYWEMSPEMGNALKKRYWNPAPGDEMPPAGAPILTHAQLLGIPIQTKEGAIGVALIVKGTIWEDGTVR